MRPATDQDVVETRSQERVRAQTAAVMDQLRMFPPSDKAYGCNVMKTKEKQDIPGVCFFKSKAAYGWAFSNFFRCIVRLRITDPANKRDGVYVFGSSEHAYQWVARVYPQNKSEEMLLRWCGGGQYDRPLPEKQAKAGAEAKKQGKTSDATAVKMANTTAGLHAKMLVSKNPQYALQRLALNPHAQGLSLVEEYELIWEPILTAKYTQTPELRQALVRTGTNVLVEYSKTFNQKEFGGYVKGDGTLFCRPDHGELTPVMIANWRTERWAANVIAHPTKHTFHAFGYNVMGDFLMRIRASVSGGPTLRPLAYAPWPNSLVTGRMGPFSARAGLVIQGGARRKGAVSKRRLGQLSTRSRYRGSPRSPCRVSGSRSSSPSQRSIRSYAGIS